MATLDQTFSTHPLEAPHRASKRASCISAFEDWVSEATFNEWHLSLYALSTDSPLCFYNPHAVDAALQFFRKHSSLTWSALSDLSRHVDHAVASLLRPTGSWTHQDSLSLDSPEDAARFDSLWHPEYQRYSEHALNHLIQIPLYVLGKLKQRDYLPQAHSNRAATLGRGIHPSLVRGFDPTVRNAIAHGASEFQLMSIRYTDNRNVKVLSPSEFGELLDSLVDTCHGLLAAILLFVAEGKGKPEALSAPALPFGLRYLLCIGQASHPSLAILAMLETHSPGTGSQLNVVCKTENPSRGAHLFDGLFLAWAAAKLRPEYDRYLMSVDCGRPTHSVLAINGKALAKAIAMDEDLAQCGAALFEGSLLWYDAPQWRSTLSTFRSLIRTRWPEVMREIRSQAEASGLVSSICKYRIALIENTSNRSSPRLTCHAYLLEGGTVTDARLIATVKHLIRRLRGHRVRRADIYGPTGLPQRPTQITIRLCARAARLRTLKSYGWPSSDLVLIAEWSRKSRAAKPFYTRQADYSHRGLRVKYNPSLISPKRNNEGSTAGAAPT